MFGIEDKSISIAYVLCIASAVLCVVYGLLMWNKGSEPVKNGDLKWIEEEKDAEEEL